MLLSCLCKYSIGSSKLKSVFPHCQPKQRLSSDLPLPVESNQINPLSSLAKSFTIVGKPNSSIDGTLKVLSHDNYTSFAYIH